MRECFCLAIVLASPALLCGLRAEPPFGDQSVSAQARPTTAPAPASRGLLGSDSLVNLGAFRVPVGPGNGNDGKTFAYGGTAPAVGNGGLYLVGHDHKQLTAQITIPEPKIAPVAELPRATFLQPFADPTGGKRWQVEGTIKIGGHLVYGGKLLTTVHEYYDGDTGQSVSHAFASLEMADAQGMFSLDGLHSGFEAGYMAAIPEAWRDVLGAPVLTGLNGVAITGRTSQGPCAIGFDPADLGVTNPAPSRPWLYYQASGTAVPEGRTLPGWLTTDYASGCAFIGDTVLFVGRRGAGPYWYGGQTSDDGKHTDPCDSSKGPHAPPYRTTVWLYDAHDLAAVVRGEKQPWDVRPYERFELSIGGDCARIGGCAYDAVKKRLYVVQKNAEPPAWEYPVVHTFEVRG